MATPVNLMCPPGFEHPVALQGAAVKSLASWTEREEVRKWRCGPFPNTTQNIPARVLPAVPLLNRDSGAQDGVNYRG